MRMLEIKYDMRILEIKYNMIITVAPLIQTRTRYLYSNFITTFHKQSLLAYNRAN